MIERRIAIWRNPWFRELRYENRKGILVEYFARAKNKISRVIYQLNAIDVSNSLSASTWFMAIKQESSIVNRLYMISKRWMKKHEFFILLIMTGSHTDMYCTRKEVTHQILVNYSNHSHYCRQLQEGILWIDSGKLRTYCICIWVIWLHSISVSKIA